MRDITISIDIDVENDVLWNMSDREKQQLAEILYDEGFYPEELESEVDRTGASTYYEIELVKILDKIWENRRSLTQNDIDVLTYLSKK
jgi:hypothetical protein